MCLFFWTTWIKISNVGFQLSVSGSVMISSTLLKMPLFLFLQIIHTLSKEVCLPDKWTPMLFKAAYAAKKNNDNPLRLLGVVTVFQTLQKQKAHNSGAIVQWVNKWSIVFLLHLHNTTLIYGSCPSFYEIVPCPGFLPSCCPQKNRRPNYKLHLQILFLSIVHWPWASLHQSFFFKIDLLPL